MNAVQYNSIRSAGLLTLSGSLVFLTGAFFPPYKQWMTSDIKEYLTIINNFQVNWYIIHGLLSMGVVISLFGVQLLVSSLHVPDKNPTNATIASTAFFFGSVLCILNFTFRLTATVWAAEHVANTGKVEDWFQSFTDWTNVIFAVFMILAYSGIAFLGFAMRDIALFPKWLSQFCIIYGIVAAVSYCFQFIVFAPPLMVYVPLVVIGLVIARKTKK